MQIINRYTGVVIFEAEGSIRDALIDAVKGGANLTYANLYGANLSRADLSGANLTYANLTDADLTDADLSGANLTDANLTDADLSGANLTYANLYGANLSRANLSRANLSYANLSDADLSGANLTYANLSGANLSDADLSGANLSGANLSGANLSGALNYKLSVAKTRICPDGDIIGWKKCKGGVLVKLLIPKDAKRNNAFGRKCRAEYAEVLEIEGSDIAHSTRDINFIYRVGDTVKPMEPFNEDFTDECSSGIHFFITREEAKDY